MDITLHVGAHRSATTSFQACLSENLGVLRAEGLDAWGPRLLRKGLFDGLGGSVVYPRAAAKVHGRVALRLSHAQARGAETLVVSEENMLGSVRANVRARLLYPDVADKLARYVAVMDGQVARIVLVVRALDHWWASACAYAVARGHSLPNARALEAMAAAPRTWRDVVADIAEVAGGAEVIVVPFERVAGRPGALLRACTGKDVALAGSDIWRNRAPSVSDLHEELAARKKPAALVEEDGRWRPFTPLQAALLREAYVDDIAWLSSGADGLATLAEDISRAQDGRSPHALACKEGHQDEREDGRVA
ncbi:MAG: hypothetical protein AAGM84_11880 [Pseudomonadota bacterium]